MLTRWSAVRDRLRKESRCASDRASCGRFRPATDDGSLWHLPLIALQGSSWACFGTADARLSPSRQFRIGFVRDFGDRGVLPGRNLSGGGEGEDRPHHYVDAWPHRAEACAHRQRCGTRGATCAVCGARGAVASSHALSECDEAARVQGSEAKPAREQVPEAVATRRGRKPIAQPCYIAAYNAKLILAGISSGFRSFWNLRPDHNEKPPARNAR